MESGAYTFWDEWYSYKDNKKDRIKLMEFLLKNNQITTKDLNTYFEELCQFLFEAGLLRDA